MLDRPQCVEQKEEKIHVDQVLACTADSAGADGRTSIRARCRDADGKPDRWTFFVSGKPDRYEEDRDFDGRLELDCFNKTKKVSVKTKQGTKMMRLAFEVNGPEHDRPAQRAKDRAKARRCA